MTTPSKSPYGICPFCGHPLRLNKKGTMVYCSQLRWRKNPFGEQEAAGNCQFRFDTRYAGKPVSPELYPYLSMGDSVILETGTEVRLYFDDERLTFTIKSMTFKGAPLKGDPDNVGFLDHRGKTPKQGLKFDFGLD